MKEKIDFGDNCFDLIRIYAAFIVMYIHAVTHLKISFSNIINTSSLIPFPPGVILFFIMTSFLGTASYERSINKNKSQGTKVYFFNRFIRIYPVLWVGFFVSAVSIYLTYKMSPSFKQLLIWIITQVTICQFYTPEFLRGFGVGTPNGSLWTIPVIIQFYILIPILYKYFKSLSLNKWILIFVLSLPLSIVQPLLEPLLPHNLFRLTGITFLPYLYILLLGMFIYLNFEKVIPLLVKWDYLIILFYIGFSILNNIVIHFEYGAYINIISGIVVCFMTLGTAYKFGKYRLKFDISYGVYIFHMIIVNIFVQKGLIGATWILWVTIFLSVACGFVIFYTVEKPLSKLKIKKKNSLSFKEFS